MDRIVAVHPVGVGLLFFKGSAPEPMGEEGVSPSKDLPNGQMVAGRGPNKGDW